MAIFLGHTVAIKATNTISNPSINHVGGANRHTRPAPPLFSFTIAIQIHSFQVGTSLFQHSNPSDYGYTYPLVV